MSEEIQVSLADLGNPTEARTITPETAMILQQLPVITDNLEAYRDQVQKAASEAQATAEASGDTTEIRKIRASLNHDYQALEDRRLEIVRQARKPIDDLNEAFKSCVAEPVKKALKAMDNAAKKIDDKVMNACETDLRAYFREGAEACQIPWLTYERAGVKFDLAAARQKSHKKQKEQILAFVKSVAQAVATINGLENSAEVMVEYQKTLDLAKSIEAVNQRHEEIRKAEEAAEARRKEREAREAAAQRVLDAMESSAPVAPVAVPVAVPAPVEVPAPVATQEAETPSTVEPAAPVVYVLPFKVSSGSIQNLRAFKAGLIDLCEKVGVELITDSTGKKD